MLGSIILWWPGGPVLQPEPRYSNAVGYRLSTATFSGEGSSLSWTKPRTAPAGSAGRSDAQNGWGGWVLAISWWANSHCVTAFLNRLNCFEVFCVLTIQHYVFAN